MVAPLVAFAGLTVAALIKQVVADYTANMAKKALARSFLVDRIDKRLERKFGKDFLKQKLDDSKLEEIRKILHEELSAFSPKKDIDQLIVNSVQKLSDEHQVILAKLDKVESLLEKISIPMAYSLAKDSEHDVPEDLLTGLLEGSLQGHSSSKKVLKELTEDNTIPLEVYDGLKNFQFIQSLSEAGDIEITHLVKKFAYSPEEINTLSTLIDISTLLTGPTKEFENIVSEFIFKMISEGINTSVIEDSIVSFCFIIHRLGKLDKISKSDRVLLGSFLRESIKKIEDPNRVLEAYFLLSHMNMAFDINTDFIKDILDRQQKQGIGSTRDMVGQLHITGRMARFLRRIGFKTTKPRTSIKTINLLIRKLDKRKFIRSTQLLQHHLTRLTSEINLLIAYFEKEEVERIDLDELIELLQLLLEILNRPRIYQLDIQTRKLVLELMDATYYLYDLLAVRNSWNLLNNYQLDVKSLYSPTLGNYQRILTDESAFNRSIADYSLKRIQKVDKVLPSPPKRKKREKIGG